MYQRTSDSADQPTVTKSPALFGCNEDLSVQPEKPTNTEAVAN